MPPLGDRELLLERAAFRAWPPAETTWLRPWCLRATHGMTRRANSVWTALGNPRNLDQAILGAEAFYRDRNQSALFQVLDGARELDARLEALGYEIEAPVSIRTASVHDALLRIPASPLVARVERAMPEDFETVLVDRGRFSDHREAFVGLLARLGRRALYATARIDGTAASVALGVLDGDLVGVFSMTTLPEFRRRGAARATLRAIIEVARAAGAKTAYLQVERDNTAAIGLYGTAGFSHRYGYEYRRKIRRPPLRPPE